MHYTRPLPSNSPTVVTSPKASTALSHLCYANYQVNNYTLFYRFLFHIFQILLIHGMIFWYFPNNAGMRRNGYPECTKNDIDMGKCNEVLSNIFLLIFYVLYALYFIISSMQIREAWPEIDKDIITTSSDIIGRGIAQGFYAIPFAWELQEIASWLWTRTCFDIFQWLKFSEIHYNLFLVNCKAKAKRLTPIGEETSKLSKYLMGGGLLFGLIFLIVVPIFVFSSLNPMVNINSVNTASLTFTLNYEETKTFTLMETTGARIQSMNESPKDESKIRKFSEIKGVDREQFQYILFANTSDTDVFPTEDKIKELHEYFKTNALPTISLEYSFTRPVIVFVN